MMWTRKAAPALSDWEVAERRALMEHAEQPYELVGDEELRGELVYGWGICLADTCPRLVELDGGGRA